MVSKFFSKLIRSVALRTCRIDESSALIPSSRDEWVYVEGEKEVHIQIERERGEFDLVLFESTMLNWKTPNGVVELVASERARIIDKVVRHLRVKHGYRVRLVAA